MTNRRPLTRYLVACVSVISLCWPMFTAAETLKSTQFSARATAAMRTCDNNRFTGFATLDEIRSPEGVKEIDVFMLMRGLTPGKHAVHIHETASCEPCGSAGGHFDPGNFSQPSPDGNHPYHSGDLININSSGDYSVMTTRTSRVTLSDGPLSLFDGDGSAFIVHVNEDTYCPEGEAAGCAGGARAACGIITKVDSAESFTLAVSTSSRRSRPVELAGAELSDSAYIFLVPANPDADVSSVRFYLDGEFFQRESQSPFDFAGTRDSGRSSRLDTSDLSNGTHTIAAYVRLDSGERAFAAAEFTVDNDSGRFLNGSENQ